MKKILLILMVLFFASWQATLYADTSADNNADNKKAEEKVNSAAESSTKSFIEALKNEPPLTEDDIQMYIKILPLVDQNRLMSLELKKKIFDITKWTPNRFAYVWGKVGVGLHKLLYPDTKFSSYQDYFVPTNDEMALISKNEKALKAALEEGEKNFPKQEQ